jgi:hypothetical protein
MSISSVPMLISRASIFAIIVFSPVVPASLAQQAPSPASCHEAIRSLSADWDAIGYPEPTKPLQARVLGGQGHVNTGIEVEYMRTQIRNAARDCSTGNDAMALRRVATVRARLDHESYGRAVQLPYR